MLWRVAAAGNSVCGIRVFGIFDPGISPGMNRVSPLNAGIEIPGEGGTPGIAVIGKAKSWPSLPINRSPDHPIKISVGCLHPIRPKNGDTWGACRREKFLNEESITYRHDGSR